MRAQGLDYAILRDQSGGTVTPLPLAELRKRLEDKPQMTLPGFGAGESANCFCNVADPGEAQAV